MKHLPRAWRDGELPWPVGIRSGRLHKIMFILHIREIDATFDGRLLAMVHYV